MNIKHIFALSPIALAVCTGNTLADEQDNTRAITRLSGVVVSASRAEENIDESVKSVDTIDAEQIELLKPRSIPEAMDGLSNVERSGGPRTLSQEVTIRGFGGNRVVQLFDGSRQNFSAGHRGSFFIDPELVQTTEVVKGASGSVWGSGAIGGVVNIQTKEASDLLDAGENFGIQLKAGYQDASKENRLSGSAYGRIGEQADYLINLTTRDSDNVRTGGGDELPNSALESNAGLVKANWDITESQRLSLNYNFLDADQQVPSNPTTNAKFEPNSSNPLVDRATQQSNLSLGYRFNNSSDLLDLSAKLYRNSTDVDETCLGFCGDALGGPNRRDSSEYTTDGLTLQNTSRFGSHSDWIATYGLDYYEDSIKSLRNGQAREQYPDSSQENTGVFARLEIPLGPVSLVPAVRYDSYENSSDTGVAANAKDSETSASLAGIWQATDWLSLTASYDEAFRAPNLVEMYPSGIHFDLFGEGDIFAGVPAMPPFVPEIAPSPALNNVFIPNPELEAEKAKSKELSARFSFTDLAGGNELKLRTTFFQSNIDNYIDQDVQVDVAHYMSAFWGSLSNPMLSFDDLFDQTRVSTTHKNIAEAEMEGYELDVNYSWQTTFASLAFGHTRGRDVTSGEKLDLPSKKLTLDFGHGFFDGEWLIGARVTNAWSKEAIEESASDVEAYTIGDIYTSWQPASGLRVDLTLNNVGDVDYRRDSFSLPEVGRNLQLSVGYRF